MMMRATSEEEEEATNSMTEQMVFDRIVVACVRKMSIKVIMNLAEIF